MGNVLSRVFWWLLFLDGNDEEATSQPDEEPHVPASDFAGDTGKSSAADTPFASESESAMNTLSTTNTYIDIPLTVGEVEMEAAARATKAFEAGDFRGALSAYTQALLEHPLSPDYLTQRSTAFARLKPPRNDLALKDAELALLSAKSRAVREKIQAAQFRRMITLYNLGRYADAAFLVEKLKLFIPKDSKPGKMQVDMWAAKCNIKTKANPDQTVTIREYPDFPSGLPSQSDMVDKFKAQLDSDGNYVFPEDVAAPSTSQQTDPATSSTEASTDCKNTTDTQPSTATSAPTPKIRHEWYQNNQNITLTLYAKGVSKSAADIEINADSVSISFPHPSNPNSTFNFTLDPLFALIDPAQSTSNIMSTKVELTLRKAQAGQKWRSLEGTSVLLPTSDQDTSSSSASTAPAIQAPPVAQSAPSYPTSSRTGPKNWDKLADDLHAQSKGKKKEKATGPASGDEEEADVDSDYDGDAVDGFFKKLYAGADPDTRRAMQKSFLESQGTALSTNWSEVGKGKVDVVKSKDDE
ncbi:Cochaperone protein [Rhinocladiella similis]